MDYNGEPNTFNISQLLPDPSLIGERELERIIAAFKQFRSPQPALTLVTEILTPEDALIRHPNMLFAVEKEIFGLSPRELF